MNTPSAGSRTGMRKATGPSAAPLPEWLNTESAARHIDYSPWTLRDWRKKGIGPPYERPHGLRGRVRYNRHALDLWMTTHHVETLADASV